MSARWILTVEYEQKDQAQQMGAILVNSMPTRWYFAYVNDNGEKVWTETAEGYGANGLRV